MVCVCVFWSVRRCQQVSEITTGLLSDPCKWLTCHSNLQAPPLPYQHHRLSVEYSGVWIVSRTHTLTHIIVHSVFIPPPIKRQNLLCFSLHLGPDLTWNFSPSDMISKSEYKSAPVPGLYPLQLLCALIRSSSPP